MRKSLFIFGMLLAGTTFITSCTKDLKKDVKELQGRLDEVENLIGSNEPITATTTFKDDNNVTRTITGTYKFKKADNQTQRLVKNVDGTYDIGIGRFSDVYGYEGVWVEFTYNPTTKEITNKELSHNWSDEDNYDDEAEYYQYDNDEISGLTFNITIDKLDLNTGDISLKVSASGTGEYTDDYDGPNPGKPVSTNFSFTGKLKKFEREEE